MIVVVGYIALFFNIVVEAQFYCGLFLYTIVNVVKCVEYGSLMKGMQCVIKFIEGIEGMHIGDILSMEGMQLFYYTLVYCSLVVIGVND